MADGQSSVASGTNPLEEYFALKTGTDGMDFVRGGRQAELNWKYAVEQSGLWRLWWLIYCQVQGIDPNTGEQNVNQQLKIVGDDDKYIAFRVQLTRILIQQKIMLAQDQRPSFEGVANNNDAGSLAQVNAASKAIEYVLTEAKLEQRAAAGLTNNGYFGAGGLHLTWDFKAGQPVEADEPIKDPDTGEPVTMPVYDPLTAAPVIDPATGQQVEEVKTQKVKKPSGAPRIEKLYPWQQRVDPFAEDAHSWVIILTPVNKYELAAAFPEKADKIVKCGLDYELGDDALFAWGSRNGVSSDVVVLRTFYHVSGAALPEGRMAQWVCDVPLLGCDQIIPNPLGDELPWEEIVSQKYFCTSFGYPESSDLLAVQSALNEVLSQTITTVQRHGNANVWKRNDVEVDEEAYRAGGAMFDLPPGAPVPEVTKFDDMGEAPRFIAEFCREIMPLMLGLNPTVQGQPESNISSGAFAVLLVNLAQKFANNMQQANDFALVGIANKALKMVKLNAQNGFWAEVTGISDSPYLKLFKPEDLSDFHAVKIVRRNPVLSTFVGRAEIFNMTKDLTKQQRFEALQLLLDSRTDAYAENDQAAAIRIRKENEDLLAGIMPTVSWSDPHPLEIAKHRAERDKIRATLPSPDDPTYAQQTALINLFDQHEVEHVKIWAMTPPPMLIAAGLPVLQAMAGPMPLDPNDTSQKPEMQPPAQPDEGGGEPGEPGSPDKPDRPAPPQGAEGAAAGQP